VRDFGDDHETQWLGHFSVRCWRGGFEHRDAGKRTETTGTVRSCLGPSRKHARMAPVAAEFRQSGANSTCRQFRLGRTGHGPDLTEDIGLEVCLIKKMQRY
jgi:hypothetical protein